MSSLPPPSGSAPEPPENHQTLVRSLLGLPELAMRVAWLNERLSPPSAAKWAPLLDRVAERAQSTDNDAREAQLAVSVLLAHRSESAWLWSLRQAAKNQSLLNLERLVREAPRDSDPNQLGLVERDRAVPDYGGGRELTVGERRSLARRPSREQVARLLLDPHPLVLEQLFQSPSLTESDVIKILTRRPASLPALQFVAVSCKWITRRRIRMSIILNPGTPHGLALPYVSTCPREDLHLIAQSTTVSPVIRGVASELFTRLPPVAETSTHRFHQ